MSSVDLIFTSNATPLTFPQGVPSTSIIKFLQNYIFVYSPSKPLIVYDLKNSFRLDVNITGDELVFIQPHNVKDDVILLATLNTIGKITVYLVYSNEKNILLPVIFAFYDEHLAFQKIFFHPTNRTVFLAASGHELYSAKISSLIPAKESYATLVSSEVVYTTTSESFKDILTMLYVFPANTITSSYSAMSSTSMQKKKRSALPQTTPIVTVAFHPDNNHAIVLLINNTLHCINLGSGQHLLFTFFMPSYSVCPFPGIKSPTSSTSPFIPIYISVFTHPAFPNSAVILLFDVHFDVIGYKLDNYILQESEEAISRTKKKRERMSVTLKSTKTSKTPMRSSRSGKSPSRFTTPSNKSPRSGRSPSRYFTPVKSQSKLSLSTSQRTSRSPPRNRRRGEDSESDEDREDEDDKNVVVLLDMLDDYEHLSITAVPKAAPIADAGSHRRGSRALLNLRSGMNTNSASFLLPVTDPNFAASVAGRSGWGPVGSASTPLPNYSRSPAASSSLAQSPSFTLSMPMTPSTLGGRSSTPSCSPSPDGNDDIVPVKAPIRANVSHDLVVDLSFDPLSRLWVVTHAVQQIVPDADEEIDENTPFSELKKPTRIISLFHIPLSASTAQRTSKKATFIPILIHNFVLLDRPNLAFSCRSHFLGAAAQVHTTSGSPLAISSSSASTSTYSPSASSLSITRVPAYIFAYFATPPPSKSDEDDANYSAPLFPFAPYPFRALSSQPGPIHPDELNPNKDDDDDDYGYADNLNLLGVFGSPAPARTSTPAPAQSPGALQAAAQAMLPVIDTALQESGHQLAAVFNALELQELASVAAVIATPSQRAALGRADRIYDLITWRRMKQAEKEHGRDIGTAAAAATERQSRRISRVIESESDGTASLRRTETFLKKASLAVYGLLEKGVYTRTTTLVLIHYSDEETEKAFRKQEREEKAKNKEKIIDEEPDMSEPDLIVLADAEAAVEEQTRQDEWDRERHKVRVKKEEEKKNEEPPRKPSYADLGEAVKTLHEELVNEHALHVDADAERNSLEETVRVNTAALQEAENRITELETNIDELEGILVGTVSEEDQDGAGTGGGKRKEEKKGEKEKEKSGEIGQNLAKWEEQLREARADADRERKRAQELEVKRVRLEDAVAEKDRKIENLTTALKEGEEGGEDSDDGSANGSDKEIISKLRERIAKLKTTVKHKNGEIVELRSTVDNTLKKVNQKLEKEGE